MYINIFLFLLEKCFHEKAQGLNIQSCLTNSFQPKQQQQKKVLFTCWLNLQLPAEFQLTVTTL